MQKKLPDYPKIISDYRELIESENRRVNERLTIFCQFQGLLFAALALGWEKASNKDLLWMLSLLGIFSAGVISRALFMATNGINILHKEYLTLPEEARRLAGPVVGNLPDEKKSKISGKGRVYFTPSIVLPVLMILGWSFIIISKILKWV